VFDAHLTLQSSETTGAINTGGALQVSSHDGAALRTIASIRGLKENSTVGNYSGYISFSTRLNGASPSEKMRLDASGNLGLGVTPSAWSGPLKALQVLSAGLYGTTSDTSQATITGNAYFDGSVFRYISTNFAQRYTQTEGNHQWYSAPSGTAGNSISFTQAMTLNASGNLSIGNTNDTYKLDVTGTGRFSATSTDYALTLQNVQDDSQGLLVRATDNDGSLFLLKLQSSNTSTGQTWVDRFTVAKNGAATFTGSITSTNSTGAISMVAAGSSDTKNSSGSFNIYDTTNNRGWGLQQDASYKLNFWHYNEGWTSVANISGTGAATFSSSVQTGGNIRTLMTGTTDVPSIYAENNVGSLAQIRVFGTSAGGTLFGVTRAGWSSIDTNNGLGLLFGTTDTAPIVIGTSNTERMRINTNGNVGIGTTNSSYPLNVYKAGLNVFSTVYNVAAFNDGTASYKGINLGYLSGEQTGVIYAETNSAASNLAFWTYSGSAWGERMRITSAGRVGILNSAPQGKFEVGVVDANSTYGGLFFSTFTIPVDTWYTVYYAPSNDQWNAITEFSWTSSGDYNRSGAAYMRWAYEGVAATLGVVYTLFNNSQNASASFRKSGNEIQVYITGGSANYYVQVRIQGSKAQ
jgi:hypothetical protein